MICPECVKGRLYGIAHMKSIEMECPRCKGTAEVPDIQAEWIEIGKEIKRLRLENNLGLRAGAVELGIQPSILSEYERGMRNPEDLKKIVEEKYNG